MSDTWPLPIPKKEELKVAPEMSIPVDVGLIRCTCLSNQDDGFTIQCENCLVWQHAYCVHITANNIPDQFFCDQCSGKKKRPKLSKRIAITKKKLSKLDLDDNNNPTLFKKKKQPVKSRVISRYATTLFDEARERWKKVWKYDSHQPFIYDMGAFVTMDADTLMNQGAFMNAPVSNQGLFATQSVTPSSYLLEVAGDILLKSEFKFDSLNDFVLLGTPLSHIMFFPALDLCVDTRQFGNKARYIRRSCQPNAELRNMVLPRDDKTVHLGLFARRLIEKEQEVTVGWAWQRGHVTWKEYMDWHHKSKKESRNKVIDEEEERKKRTAINRMLERFEKEFGSCACTNKQKCFIEHLKKQSTVKKRIEASRRRRSKPSILLLKPRPNIDKVHSDEYVDVTSNSPPLKVDSPLEDDNDELLDIDGDVDIVGGEFSHDMSIVDEIHQSDDLSSISSSSSLFATEEKELAHSERKSLNSTTTHVKDPVTLPRKKVWARDYLSKATDTTITEFPVKEEAQNIESKTDNTPKPNNHEKQVDTTRDTPNQATVGDEDEGELSDASTVLLEDICT